jgi:hypothetical protein
VVGEDGGRIRRAGLKLTVLLIITQTFGGMSNTSTDAAGTLETDADGEVDVTDKLPAPNPAALEGFTFAFLVEGEGLPKASWMSPPVRVPVEEVARRVRECAPDPLVIEVPARDWRPITLRVRDAAGNPATGVTLVGRPAASFKDAEYVTDARGETRLRVVMREPRMGPPDRSYRFPGGEDGPRVLALSPWFGKIYLDGLLNPGLQVPVEMLQPRGGPPGVLVVVRGVSTTLTLVDELGRPVASADVRVDGEEVRTDGAGAVEWIGPEGGAEVAVDAPGHFPATCKVDPSARRMEVLLTRSREITVSVRLPEGAKPVAYKVHAVEPGDEKRYPSRLLDYGSGRHRYVLVVPRRTVRVNAESWDGGMGAEASLDPETAEVELTLQAR